MIDVSRTPNLFSVCFDTHSWRFLDNREVVEHSCLGQVAALDDMLKTFTLITFDICLGETVTGACNEYCRRDDENAQFFEGFTKTGKDLF